MAKSKLKSQMQRAKRSGMSMVDFARVKANADRTAEKYTKEMETRATEKAFLFMLAIPLNVLVADYWEKSAKKKIPKFIEECMKLYKAVEEETVSVQELADLLKEYAGVEITAEWMGKIRNGDDESEVDMN